ncbi:MAG: hypothetical protein M1832_005149 [Thelocarpon impressellum]|nr:MAG: hypothetical protein M1832_005149 [Thelocarpon impressellum]
MASAFRNLLTKTSALLSPTSPSPAALPPGFRTAALPSALFPPADPAADGASCLEDCASCTLSYPARFRINDYHDLYGHVRPWATHVLVATGKADWAREVSNERGSLLEALSENGHVGPTNGEMMLSASDIPLPAADDKHHLPEQRPTSVLILPAFLVVENVTPSDAPFLLTHFISPSPTTTSPLSPSPPVPTSLRLRAHRSNHAYLILLCSHRSRDARCGQSAPLLKRELSRHLRALQLLRDADDARPGGCAIHFVSHVGGHKYAANVLVYRRDAGQAVWLARVRPQDCEAVVRYTVLRGEVVRGESMLRGGFDRGRGLVSW